MSHDTPYAQQGSNSGNLPANRPASGGSSGRALVSVVIGLIVLGGFFVLGMAPRSARNARLRQRARTASSSIPQIPVMKLNGAPNSDLALPGTTEAIVDAVIAARTSGYLSKRYVDIGDHVTAGQPLAVVESPDVDQQLYQAQAQESQSRALTQQAVADLANKRATVTQYRSNVSQAQANVEQANAQLADAQAKLAQFVAAKAGVEAQEEEAQHQVDVKQAALVQAQTQSNLNEVTYKRYKTLLDSGYVALQDVDQAEATYKNAVAAVHSAEADLNASRSAVKSVHQQVASAQANIDSGKAEVLAAEKNVRAVMATVHSNESTVTAAQANVRLGQSNVRASMDVERANRFNSKHYAVLTGFEKVVAPFAGVITARNVDVGTLVSAGAGSGGSGGGGSSTSTGSAVNLGSASTGSATGSAASGGGLFGLARIDVIRILVTVPEVNSRTIHVGILARVTLREFPGRTFQGTVARMSGALDTNSRTRLTEVHIPNPDGAILPGMFAQVHFEVSNSANEFRVPASSVINDALGTRVAIVAADNTVHFVNVKVARDFGKEMDIHDGINGTEQLITNPTDDLTEGETVKPVLGAPLASGTAPGSVSAPAQSGSAPPRGSAH